ncbi:putative PH domain-containing protein [Lachnellula subtilissima]|uniref:Putative PH domain-containing protein n=1 Tax=Lachnellula subtilissima TaxID=602034 RepID=A0A8H8RXS7_9HELO|nr:putative PH domain-containing protein [Lachnellula subtilissima]
MIMADVQIQTQTQTQKQKQTPTAMMPEASQPRQIPPRTTALQIPRSAAVSLPPSSSASRMLNSHLALDSFSPVNQNGSFEFDRVLKSGYVQKRTRRTKAWKPIYLVLRSNFLSIYRDQKEDKLRHKIQLADLTAVAFLKDPKHKRENVFGLFSPSRNYHLEAKSRKDAEEWRQRHRHIRRFDRAMQQHNEAKLLHDERLGSSSPEPLESMPQPRTKLGGPRKTSHTFDYSGNELASHSDMSDNDFARAAGASSLSITEESLAVQAPGTGTGMRPMLGARNASQMSVLNPELDPERVVWQGHLLYLKSKNGIRQWKDLWAVIRPRNIQFYKNDSEYSTLVIIPLNSVINAVEIDPLSRTKRLCFQVITEEKSYKFCARTEDGLNKCLGAIKSLLAKRKEGEMGARGR